MEKKPTYEELRKRVLLFEKEASRQSKIEGALEKRILALTQPLDDTKSIHFKDLFNMDDIQRLQDEFALATGVASIITMPDGTPITQPSNFCRLCKDIIRKTEKGLINCYQSDAVLGRLTSVGPAIQPCMSGGLWDAGAGISIGGRHIANWLIGQVRDSTQTEDKMRQYAREIGANESETVAAFREVPSMSRKRFERVAQVLFTLANQLSNFAYQNVQQARFITERKKIEKALRTSKERYQALTDLLPIGIFEIVNGGEITFANQAAFQMTGYNQADLESGLNMLQIIAPQDHDKALNRSQQVLEGECTDGSEYQIIRKNGEAFPAFINTRPSIDESAHGLIGYIFDLSSIKETEKALRESEEKLARSKKMESLGLLAGGVAHDLNNILSGIVSYPELILMDMSDGDKLKKPIETIMEAGQRATAVVQDLLTVARGVAIPNEPMNLNDLVNNFLNSPEFNKLQQICPSVTFNADLDEELFNIVGSYVHLRKALMNLVANASEALVGAGQVNISTSNRYLDRPISGYDNVNEGEYALLSVADGGTGICHEDFERIFEPFYTKKMMGRSGTGLGLAVVWNVVQDHHGYIDVRTSSSGTTFTLYFPITRSAVMDDESSTTIESYAGKGETILIVDDVKSQREISSKMIERLGYTAQAVSSGEEAIDYIKKQSVKLLLLDMIMDPGINGRETYERIKQVNPDQKAIIFSGYAETAEVKKTLKLGAGTFLKKPINLEKLGFAIKEELNKKE